MARISASKLSLDYPAFDASDLSLKKMVLRTLMFQRQGAVMVRRLHELDFDIRDGNRVGLFGPNGSGKTSLLRVLAGVFAPSGGTLEIVGQRSSILGLGAGIQPDLSADSNIKLLMRVDGRVPTDQEVDDIWRFTELGDEFRHQPLKAFSSGMQMRVLFSVATSCPTDILLLDEWLSVADERFRQRAEDRMSRFVAETSIVVIASHSLDMLERVCNRIIYLEEGRISRVREIGEEKQPTGSTTTAQMDACG